MGFWDPCSHAKAMEVLWTDTFGLSLCSLTWGTETVNLALAQWKNPLWFKHHAQQGLSKQCSVHLRGTWSHKHTRWMAYYLSSVHLNT